MWCESISIHWDPPVAVSTCLAWLLALGGPHNQQISLHIDDIHTRCNFNLVISRINWGLPAAPTPKKFKPSGPTFRTSCRTLIHYTTALMQSCQWAWASCVRVHLCGSGRESRSNGLDLDPCLRYETITEWMQPYGLRPDGLGSNPNILRWEDLGLPISQALGSMSNPDSKIELLNC